MLKGFRFTHHLIASSSSTARFFILHTARPIRRRTTNPAPTLIPMTAPRGIASPSLSSSFSFAVGVAEAGTEDLDTDSVTIDCMTVTTTVSPPASTEREVEGLSRSAIIPESF